MKIEVAYSLPNSNVNVEKTIESKGPVRIGLPGSLQPFKPEPGDTRYCGQHDAGLLCPPREHNGPMAIVIANVQQAKELNDSFLTQVILQQQATMPPRKKPKTATEQPSP